MTITTARAEARQRATRLGHRVGRFAPVRGAESVAGCKLCGLAVVVRAEPATAAKRWRGHLGSPRPCAGDQQTLELV